MRLVFFCQAGRSTDEAVHTEKNDMSYKYCTLIYFAVIEMFVMKQSFCKFVTKMENTFIGQ
jgi:hypothetical protein